MAGTETGTDADTAFNVGHGHVRLLVTQHRLPTTRMVLRSDSDWDKGTS
jgi:hypothetical protein